MSDFKRSLDKVLVHEGGYVNHPKDPGGATNQGVIQATYDMYRKAKGLPKRSVKQLTAKERDDIYRTRYWNVIKGDQLPSGVNYVVFDGAVNSGPSQSAKWLQRALGSRYDGRIDGLIGQTTLAAVADYPDHAKLVADIIERRFAFLRALKTWPTFGKGWTSRLNGVRAVGQAWAKNGPATITPIAEYQGEDAAAKAPIEDAKKAASKAPGDAAVGGGIGAGGLAGTLQQAQEQLTPFSSAGAWIGTLVAVLAVSGVVLTFGGLAYRFYVKRREAERADALDLVAA